MPEENYLSQVEADILCFATRYAMTRATAAPDIVSAEIVRVWPRLRPWQQEQIQKELREEAKWKHVWQEVFELKISPR